MKSHEHFWHFEFGFKSEITDKDFIKVRRVCTECGRKERGLVKNWVRIPRR